MAKEMETLYSELFEAAGVGRRFGEGLARGRGQTQARWQTMWIIDHDTRLTVPQIARRLGVTRQSVQRVIDELTTEHLVEAVANPDHKTSPLFQLNDRGHAVLQGINDDAALAHSRIMETFPREDVQELRRLLTALSVATRAHHDV